jgi:ribosome biogenesis protein ERB1
LKSFKDLRNTIGNIPVQWYDEYGHVGYDLAGRRIGKASSGKERTGEIESFLRREEDSDYW